MKLDKKPNERCVMGEVGLTIGREITKAVRNLRQLSAKTYTKKLHLLFQKHKD